MKKLVAIFLSIVMLLSLAACGDEFKVKKTEDFRDWFNLSLVPSYDGYLASPDGESAIYPSVSLMLASDSYINAVFDYICDGVFPENGDVTEENGVYTYSYGEFKQTFEFDADKCAVKVTMAMEMMGDSRTEFVAVFAEEKDEFFVQYLMPTFGEYYEMRFTAESGSTLTKTNCYEFPYDIFTDDIPKEFAKES